MPGSIGTRKWWVNLRPAGLPGFLVSLAIKTPCISSYVSYNYSYINRSVKVIGMRKIADYGNGIEVWIVGGEFFVYGLTADPRICPSEGMAREVAGGAL